MIFSVISLSPLSIQILDSDNHRFTPGVPVLWIFLKFISFKVHHLCWEWQLFHTFPLFWMCLEVRSEKWPLGSGFISLPSVAAFSGLLTWLTESLPPLQQQHSVSHNYIIIKFPKVWKILYLHCNTMIMIEQTLSFLINHSNHWLPVSTWSLQRTEQQHYVWLLFDYQFLTSSFQQCSGVWSTSPRCHGVGMTSPPSLTDWLLPFHENKNIVAAIKHFTSHQVVPVHFYMLWLPPWLTSTLIWRMWGNIRIFSPMKPLTTLICIHVFSW